METSIEEYVQQVLALLFYAVFDGARAVGFAAVKVHNAFTAEVCVMGILAAYHRQGLGKTLIEHCEKYCKNNHHAFLTVKTLDESRTSKSYEKTRSFYLAMGFVPLEVFPLHWNEENPCLFMAKHISV
ncbi:MAG: GNAT family N-acetyltransferase [Clostridiales bacterium]|nr:GNAT family N-acetyltransferase [Clostridiales bacterium]